VRAVSLANNHALDYEAEALADTLVLLEEGGIAAAGAGRGTGAARRPAIVDADGVRIGLVGVSDHPAEYAASQDTEGIAHADLSHRCPPWLLEGLASLRERCDRIIAFPHWGPNMVAEPAPWQLSRASELQEAGAELVAGHSAHVFHGVGWSPAGPVLTDLGDALDDYRVDPVLRNDLGVLAIWEVGAERNALQLVGLKLEYCRTELARGADAEWTAARLKRACSALGTAVERLEEARFRVTA
jgi:poly-gamma-glutamate synthesis protein (capsule biosynthesis protein)